MNFKFNVIRSFKTLNFQTVHCLNFKKIKSFFLFRNIDKKILEKFIQNYIKIWRTSWQLTKAIIIFYFLFKKNYLILIIKNIEKIKNSRG